VLLHAGRAKQAVKVLKPFDDKFAEQEVYLSLLSKALGKAGNLSKAYQTRAQLLVLLHLPKAALTQLEQAKKFAKGDAIQSARIEHEIKMLKRNFDLTT
jgi:predicted Zn-dependent protease